MTQEGASKSLFWQHRLLGCPIAAATLPDMHPPRAFGHTPDGQYLQRHAALLRLG